MSSRKATVLWTFFIFVLTQPGLTVPSRSNSELEKLIREILAIPSVTGNEELLAAKILSLLPRGFPVETDNLGSVYARPGAGKGRGELAILAPLDEFGWFVSAITPDGFLRLDRAAPPPHRLYDSFLLGHAVIISTQAGLLNGVVSQPAMHLLTRERREELGKGIPLELIYIDIGARSESEVRAKGIQFLDAVSFKPDLVRLASEEWAGPSLGQKALCAVLVEVALKSSSGELQPAHLVWMAQARFLARGQGTRFSLGAARAQARLQPRTVLVLDTVASEAEQGPFLGQGPLLWKPRDAPSALGDSVERAAGVKKIQLQLRKGGESSVMAPFLAQEVDVITLGLPVKFHQTPSEVISLKDAQSLSELILEVLKEER